MKQIENIARRWAQQNERIFIREQNKMRIGKTNALRRSVSSFTKRTSISQVETGNSFLRRGRFVDMGVGKGVRVGQRGTNRKAKKWYSPVFYGRLNALQGVVQASVNEDILKAIRKAV